MKNTKHTINTLRSHLTYECVFVSLAILTVALLTHEVVTQPDADTIQLYVQIDFWIAWFFMFDYTIGFIAAPDKKVYWRENWLILLSSLPINEHMFRSLRILRLFRLARLIKSLHQATHSPRRQRKTKHLREH